MKLIVEQSENVEFLKESSPDGKGNLFIEGVFLQADIKNRNGRIYESKVLKPSVNDYIETQVKNNRAVGELNHPSSHTVNLDKVSHRITKLSWTKNDVVGKALILNTPMGEVVKGLHEGGVKLAVSSRGLGSLESRDGTQYVKEGYLISAVDIVQDPSAPNAFINGILEGVEFFKDPTGEWKTKAENIRKKSNYITEEMKTKFQLKLFKDFLNSL